MRVSFDTVFAFLFKTFFKAYFEECLSLLHSLTYTKISPELWQIYPMVYQAFLTSGTTFFNGFFPLTFFIDFYKFKIACPFSIPS
jgi:hypothetical protein